MNRAEVSPRGGFERQELITLTFAYLLVVALYTLGGSLNPFPLSWGDSAIYLGFATNLVHHGDFSFNNLFNVITPPGYPLVLVLPVLLSSNLQEFLLLGALFQGLFYASILFGAAILFRREGVSFGISVALGLALSLSPTAFQYTQDVMSESLFIPLMFWVFVLVTSPELRTKHLLLLAVFLPWMVLTKPFGIVPAYGFVFFLGYQLWSQAALRRFFFFYLLILILPFLSLKLWLHYEQHFCDFPFAGSETRFPAHLIATFSSLENFTVYLQRLGYQALYALFGTFFLPLAFLFVDKDGYLSRNRHTVIFAVLLWLSMASLCHLVQSIAFRLPDGHYWLYGRYTEGFIPILFVLAALQFLDVRKRGAFQSKQYLLLLVIAGAVVLFCIALFPYSLWKGLYSIAVIPFLYTFSRSSFIWLWAFSFACLYVAAILGGKKRVWTGLLYLGVCCGLFTYANFSEMKRVYGAKIRWRDSVMTRPVFQKSPPEKTKYIIVHKNVARDRYLLFFRAVYLQARFVRRADLPDEMPEGVVVVTNREAPPKDFEPCGRLPGGANLFCQV